MSPSSAPRSVDDSVVIAATQLQNGYALAIDSRDWSGFEQLFTPDVRAIYPNASFEGMVSWLGFFIPFHDGCRWTQHSMSTHLVGVNDDGVWATCYGSIRWIEEDAPALLRHAEGYYRDRLVETPTGWRIARRRLDLVLVESTPANVEVLHFPASVEALVTTP